MNDAGLDEPISSAFSEVKENVGDHDEHTSSSTQGDSRTTSPKQSPAIRGDLQSPAHADSQDRKRFSSQPNAWWGASTAFPLIAGTFGPMANAFSVCALVETWRVDIAPGGTASTGTPVPDPHWLIAVNAVSLVCAIIANLSLLMNMARRLSFSVAQPITILGFWISSIILIGLVVTTTLVFEPPEVQGRALSQAFYFACWAAGIYQIIAYLMCINVYGALRQKYDREFMLTTAQRSLMLQTITLLVYLLLGALVYNKVEGWKYTDAVYWATFTLLTIGIGDFVPATHLGRSLLFPYALGGIVFLGLIISSIRSLLLDRGKQNMAARLTDNFRRKLLEEIESIQNKRKRKLKPLTILERGLKEKIMAGPSEDADEELSRRQAEFEAMRRVQYLSSRRQKWMNLIVSAVAWASLWLIGALVFTYTERRQQDWSYFASLYFCYTSLLTIGYGDLYPVTDAGKAFFVFWALLAIPSLTILISNMGDTVIKVVKDSTIYLGELTILPSTEHRVRDRLRVGLRRILPRYGHSSNGNSPDKRRGDQRHVDSEKAQKSEQMDPDSVSTQCDSNEHVKFDQNNHHYHNLLIRQIRRVHADTQLPQPKKYEYDEWAFFLKILGEDESQGSFHRVPTARDAQTSNSHDADTSTGTTADTAKETRSEQQSQSQSQETNTNTNQVRTKWSWIGPQSPLLSDKHESVLLLELLFERLEQSLRVIVDPSSTSVEPTPEPNT